MSKKKLTAQQWAIIRAKRRADSKVPRKVPVGRTLRTSDWYLPYDKNHTKDMKSKRWVAVIDKNDDEELAVVRLTTQNQPNTTLLPGYRGLNNSPSYFKHFVEIEDDKGNPIKVDGSRFISNKSRYDLQDDDVSYVKTVVYHHVKQSASNNNKIKKLLGKKKNPRRS